VDMPDLETSGVDVEKRLLIQRYWKAKKMDVERESASVAGGRSKESAASVRAVGTGSSSPASLHDPITCSLRQHPASSNVDLALEADILDSHHGLAHPLFLLFLISSTDDVPAFSSSSSSLNEKPYVHLSLELVDVLESDRTIILSRRMHIPSTYFNDPRARLALLAALSLLTLLANFLLRPTFSSYVRSRRIQDQGYEPVPSTEPSGSGGEAEPGEENGKEKSFLERNGG
jgi:hypothetical protein